VDPRQRANDYPERFLDHKLPSEIVKKSFAMAQRLRLKVQPGTFVIKSDGGMFSL
jgi:hypothetical protein